MDHSRREFLQQAGLLAASLVVPTTEGQEANGSEGNIPPLLPESRLSDPIANLKPHYDLVVIGSGYGGSIVAARLAGRLSLCLLERGREWRSGDFPKSFGEASEAIRTSRTPLGLFDFRFFDEMDLLVGSGLGGTSLINANVALVPDTDVFEQSPWPEALRESQRSGELGQYFHLAKQVIEVAAVPPTLQDLRRLRVHQQSSQAVGAAFDRLELAVNFEGSRNSHGISRQPCRLCGNCVTGCNYQSKNHLTANYLPMAKQAGGEIYTQVEVDSVARLPNGEFEIFLTYYDSERTAVPGSLRARSVVIAAGVLGSTQILLRSRQKHGLPLSRHLGKRFSANGDFLGISFNGDTRADTLGFDQLGAAERAGLRTGPTILCAADYRDRQKMTERILIEDGAFPRALVDILRRALAVQAIPTTRKKLQRVWRDWVRFDPEGALNYSMLYLGMGHDDASGTLDLSSGGIRLRWPGVREQEVYRLLPEEMQKHNTVRNGTFLNPDPRSSNLLGRHLITVHPLGGCPMGSSAEEGVVNHRGNVFDPDRGKDAVHRGLFVLDGSIIPTSLGVNPFLTISALAERAAAQLTTLI